MHLVVIGLNHKTAPVDLRERLAVCDSELAAALTRLKCNPYIIEVCIVSTCNRTEIYAVTRQRTDDDLIIDFLADYGGIGRDELEQHIYCFQGYQAVKHLFEVSCGLDSMALGETQILGQIKNAYCIAGDNDSTSAMLNNLFQRAIVVGKRARTETQISCGAFSIGAAAAQLAKSVLGDLKGRRALLLGAGDMSKLAATHLLSSGVERIFIASRTRTRVEEMAHLLGGEAIDFESFESALHDVDFLISSTSAPHPLVTKSLMERVMSARSNSPIFLIDIAVPRDIEPEVAELENVFLYNIDGLQCFVDQCKSERECEVERVREIIGEETAEYMKYLRTLEVVPLIKQLREKTNSVFAAEWEKCSSKLSHLPEEDRERVRKALVSITKKLTHDPILRIKDYASNGGSHKLEVVRELFDISSDDFPGKREP